jgi:hypothetical protein
VRYLQDDAECPYCEVDRYMAQRDELAERVKTELTAIERWAGEQNAGNVFAEQVRFWARSKLAALARLDSEGAEA